MPIQDFFNYRIINRTPPDNNKKDIFIDCLLYGVINILSNELDNDGWVKRPDLLDRLSTRFKDDPNIPLNWGKDGLKLDTLLAHRFRRNDNIAVFLNYYIDRQYASEGDNQVAGYRIKRDRMNEVREYLAATPVTDVQERNLIQGRLNYLNEKAKSKKPPSTAPSMQLESPLNQILYGPPGTGKTFNTINLALDILGDSLILGDGTQIARNDLKETFDDYIDEGMIHFTTFHQSMSYEDFIEGIKPENKDNTVTYNIKPGIFKKLCELAKDKKDEKFVLIIDEINRGNISAIFGELITLIEEGKRIGQDEALTVTLPYSKESFGVPDNVYIIGTMNTADRSVEALDAALRRRFSFVEMNPKPEVIKKYYKEDWEKFNNVNLASLLEKINLRIEKLLDKDHQIGHSYFLNLENFESLRFTFKNKILPLLKEYFFGDIAKIGLVLGQNFLTRRNLKNVNFADFEYDDIDDLNDRSEYEFQDIMTRNAEHFISIYE